MPLGTVGIVAGTLSTAGYVVLSPLLERRCGIADTCGVGNLHGVPGILGGLTSALLSWLLSAPNKAIIPHGAGQPLVQLESLALTLAVAAAGGLVGGLLVSKVNLAKQDLAEGELYEDAVFWHEVEPEGEKE